MTLRCIRDKREAPARRSSPPAARAKMLAVDVGRGQHVGDGFRIGLPVRLIEALEFQVRCGARHREALRHGRAFRQHAGKVRLCPDRREIDAAVMEAIGIHQSRDQAKRQIVPVDGMGGKQRPAGLEFDGPEAVELERGLAFFGKRRFCELRRDMKA
jgi:hypothetical protein